VHYCVEHDFLWNTANVYLSIKHDIHVILSYQIFFLDIDFYLNFMKCKISEKLHKYNIKHATALIDRKMSYINISLIY